MYREVIKPKPYLVAGNLQSKSLGAVIRELVHSRLRSVTGSQCAFRFAVRLVSLLQSRVVY